MKTQEPNEIINYDTIQVKLYELKDYRKFDLYARSLMQYQIRQGIQVLENRIWRLRNEKLKLQQHDSMIEKTKEEEFVKQGYKKVRAEKE